MKLSAPLIAVFVAALSLSACGGGSSGGSAVVVSSPATLTITDTVVGTGATAASGLNATVTYTGWLYSATAANFKGNQFDAGSFTFKLGAKAVITGFDAGVTGMKVGGTRTVLIPSAQAYGANAPTGIPANSGLVFEIKLTAVQ
ncbi:MAG: FKBP-type peptidyl-prolyl cis-trans isomerase [Pseudomonadota bacterium]|nr:FKBP-type peptidyl-prolyl cis-trans isomerase [Pseudomonadota bacterium]